MARAEPALALSRGEIARLIPHQGAMCLLERVIAWEMGRIVCAVVAPEAPDHPLRRAGALPALAGVEYGLQAAALHGALHDGAPQRPGFLAALSDVTLAVETLDGHGALCVEAALLHADGRGLIYRFSLGCGDAGKILLAGRAVIVLPARATEPP
uniref:Hydroxymyristoyl-ACP dehydratase n=1 Tax=Acidicaldus sp. TaxID=1872105 RepID=A0A8J4HEE7_9PROT